MKTVTRTRRQCDHDPQRKPPSRTWYRIALVGILIVAGFLHFFRLDQEGFANQYYATAVKSMLTSWHNFYFVSFDPAGFVSVDKPPVGLWIQTASAALLGYSGISLLLPQAVAGVLSVLVLYNLVRRTFGPAAGLLAALVLAVTPISVAANRNNTMDSLLVFVLLLATWAITLAAERGQLRWLLLSTALVGLGFNIKMLQAFLVLPAFYLLYLIAPPISFWRRVLHLTLATVVLLSVSLAWAVTVDMTPEDTRPYVGSSENNTVLELIAGHNGLSRLLPRGWRTLLTSEQEEQPQVADGHTGVGQPGRLQAPPSSSQNLPDPQSQRDRMLPQAPPAQNSNPPPNRDLPPGQSLQHPAGPGTASADRQPFASEIGEPGILRLANKQLGGQISWLLPLAGLGLLAAAWQTSFRLPLSRRHQTLLMWATWLITMVLFFSIANLFHRYYLEMLAPAIAALVGIGVTALWEDYGRPGWKGWLLPVALLLTSGMEGYILSEFPSWSRWLTPAVIGTCLAASVGLTAARIARRREISLTRVATTIAVLALLLPPTVWAMTPVLYGGSAALPYAGPDLLNEPSRDLARQAQYGSRTSKLVEYLIANHTDEIFLVAALRANDVAPVIQASAQPAMALGGFTGSDPILTAEEVGEAVASGDVRFFLLSPHGQNHVEIVRWVTNTCEVVSSALWQEAGRGDTSPGQSRTQGGMQLFDCGTLTRQ